MFTPEPIDVNRLREIWYSLYLIWQAVNFLSLFIISAGSVIVASKWQRLASTKEPLALLVAIISSFYAVLGPAEKADSYRQAWVSLNSALVSQSDLPELMKEAILRGEELIARRSAPRTTVR